MTVLSTVCVIGWVESLTPRTTVGIASRGDSLFEVSSVTGTPGWGGTDGDSTGSGCNIGANPAGDPGGAPGNGPDADPGAVS
jgi:hypothetical protein